MAGMSGKLKGGLGIALLVAALAVFLWARVAYLSAQGKPVFWLAELFSPVAVFTVLLVTFVDKLVNPRNPKKVKKRRF